MLPTMKSTLRILSSALFGLIAPGGASTATAQNAPTFSVLWPGDVHDAPEAIVSLDADDDNDDGVPDLAEQPAPDPAQDDEVVRVSVRGVTTGALHVTTTGGVRVLDAVGAVTEATLPVNAGQCVVALLGVRASERARDASVRFSAGGTSRDVAITVVDVAVLGGNNTRRFAHRDALAISHEVTTNDTLPRLSTWGERSPDPDNARIEVWDPGAASVSLARVEVLGTRASIGIAPGALRSRLTELPLTRPDSAVGLRSRFVRLVGDDLDRRAPGVQGQTLLVGVRDRVRVRYDRAGVAGEATYDLRVMRPGNEEGPLAARRGRWRVLVLRHRGDRTGPVVGDTDAGALRIGRRQVEIANEAYAQCAITWGDPADAAVSVVDVPRDALLSVGDADGLRSTGAVVRFSVNQVPIGPVRVPAGLRPVETAQLLARAVRAAGFTVRVSLNPRTDYGSDGSADLLARDRAGRLASFAAIAGVALTTDARQRVNIGHVDLADGIDEFNNLNAASGTLEERALIKPLIDDDPSTIELFVVNRFARGTRIGEAFVEGAGGPIVNGLLIDRLGISAEREAWTQSHEVGHVLLDQPWHPDNMGPDRPWLLMDADASLAAVTGPKRLTVEECARIHQQSGVGAVPALLTRYDVVEPSPRAMAFRSWPEQSLHPTRDEGATPLLEATPPRTRERVEAPAAREFGVELIP